MEESGIVSFRSLPWMRGIGVYKRYSYRGEVQTPTPSKSPFTHPIPPPATNKQQNERTLLSQPTTRLGSTLDSRALIRFGILISSCHLLIND